nr:hypothetical protein [Micromonospora sp. DSM 115978]
MALGTGGWLASSSGDGETLALVGGGTTATDPEPTPVEEPTPADGASSASEGPLPSEEPADTPPFDPAPAPDLAPAARPASGNGAAGERDDSNRPTVADSAR